MGQYGPFLFGNFKGFRYPAATLGWQKACSSLEGLPLWVIQKEIMEQPRPGGCLGVASQLLP